MASSWKPEYKNRVVRALYDSDDVNDSPQPQLDFSEGGLIRVTGDGPEPGWWKGEIPHRQLSQDGRAHRRGCFSLDKVVWMHSVADELRDKEAIENRVAALESIPQSPSIQTLLVQFAGSLVPQDVAVELLLKSLATTIDISFNPARQKPVSLNEVNDAIDTVLHPSVQRSFYRR